MVLSYSLLLLLLVLEIPGAALDVVLDWLFGVHWVELSALLISEWLIVIVVLGSSPQ